MNDRYTTDDRKGQTRKSAATMKPKSKAASTVHVQSTTKTKQQKKAEQKAARQKQSQVDRKYYNPPTEQYKKLRRMWWILLVAAIAMTAFSWLSRSWFPNNEMVSFIALGLAYVLIIAALYVDFSKIRKVRRAYQEEMESRRRRRPSSRRKHPGRARRPKRRLWKRRRSEASSAADSGFRKQNLQKPPRRPTRLRLERMGPAGNPMRPRATASSTRSRRKTLPRIRRNNRFSELRSV